MQMAMHQRAQQIQTYQLKQRALHHADPSGGPVPHQFQNFDGTDKNRNQQKSLIGETGSSNPNQQAKCLISPTNGSPLIYEESYLGSEDKSNATPVHETGQINIQKVSKNQDYSKIQRNIKRIVDRQTQSRLEVSSNTKNMLM